LHGARFSSGLDFTKNITTIHPLLFFWWQKVMKTENAFSLIASTREDQDDINALSEAFSLKAFHYIDIAREERLNNLLARWPLLQELAADQEPQR